MKRRLAFSFVSALALAGLAALPAGAQLADVTEGVNPDADTLAGAPGWIQTAQHSLHTAPTEVDTGLPLVAPSLTPEQPPTPPLGTLPNQPTPAPTPLESPAPVDTTPAQLHAQPTQPDTSQDARRLLAGAQACRACELSGVDLSYRDFPSRDLSEAHLAAANLSLGTFDRVRFSDANLSGINGFGVRAMSADFTGADLSGATFVGSWLGGSNFAGANFAGANLGGANMARTTGLTQSQLNQACGDAWTVLPRGLTAPSCLPQS